MDSKERFDHYVEYGWAPAPQDSLPDYVQDLLGRMGFEPRMKECFANCQRFMVDYARLVRRLGLEHEVEYHEGYVISLIPFEHAWLVIDGTIVDITLGSDRDIRYLRSYTYSSDEINRNLAESGMYKPLTGHRDLHALSPW